MLDIDKKTRERNKELVERYPFLLPRNVFTDKLSEDYNYEYTWYDDIDKGWQIGFGEFLLENLRDALIKTNYIDKFRFMQIKEKYGSLRLYTNGVPDKVHDVLQKYEFISNFICIQCGSPHACIVNDYGWYLPLCRECWEEQNKKREEKGYKTISYEKAANEKYEENEENDTDDVSEGVDKLPDWYKTITYSIKNGEQETIHDISEITKKIKEAYVERTKTC